jgi:uncharacterized protein (DUF2062 family)
MVAHKIKNFFISLVAREPSPHKLALAFSLGVYVAFSPFPGFHTLTVLFFSLLLRLNFFVMFLVSNLVNNPWTMVPVYAADYLCGDALCYALFGHNFTIHNPSWMEWINGMIAQYVGLQEISLCSFLIGGNILGIVFAAISYPIVRYILSKIIPEHRLVKSC